MGIDEGLYERVQAAGPDNAILLGERIWWVGHYLEDDPFQCHVYLIENGGNSVLIDPGGLLTFESVKRKIEQVIPFSNIRYFICQHQDPDIAGALPVIDQLVSRPDAEILSHWRINALLRHYGTRLPLGCIEEHGWRLDIGGRTLEFVFTPYAHSPGAFCTLDSKTRTLFSSDLFGGYTQGFSLVARDESYFEFIRPFHEHYIPSHEVQMVAMERIRAKRPKLIAPQHGSLIPSSLTNHFIDRLSNLECGVFLLGGQSTAVHRLVQLNRMLREMTHSMVLYRDFREVILKLEEHFAVLFVDSELCFYAQATDGKMIYMGPDTRYHAKVVTPSPMLSQLINHSSQRGDYERDGITMVEADEILHPGHLAVDCDAAFCIALDAEESSFRGLTVMLPRQSWTPPDDFNVITDQLRVPLQVALEREVLMRELDADRQRLSEMANRDALTGLFNRYYLKDTVARLFSIQDRGEQLPIGLLLCDIDHFKRVNDTYGHPVGDEVLKRVAGILLETVRGTDFPVRMGGEEFAIMIFGETVERRVEFSERLRRLIKEIGGEGWPLDNNVTISIGSAVRRPGESLDELVARADEALYRAKNGGRDRVCDSEAS